MEALEGVFEFMYPPWMSSIQCCKTVSGRRRRSKEERLDICLQESVNAALKSHILGPFELLSSGSPAVPRQRTHTRRSARTVWPGGRRLSDEALTFLLSGLAANPPPRETAGGRHALTLGRRGKL